MESKKFKMKRIVNNVLLTIYKVVKGLYGMIKNYYPLIVFICGLTLINVGIYMFIPILCYITTGAALVVLAVVLDRQVDKSVELEVKEGESVKKGS